MNQFVNCGFSVQGFSRSRLWRRASFKNARIKVSYDRSSIVAVVEGYFAGLHDGNADRLGAMFHLFPVCCRLPADRLQGLPPRSLRVKKAINGP